MISPGIGRVVWYYPGGLPSKARGDQPFSAQVAFVHSDRLVNLGYLDGNGVAGSATSVTLVQEGDEYPGGPFCCWMPYQIDAAKRHAAEPSRN